MEKKKQSPSLSPGGWGVSPYDTSGKESACQCRRCKRHWFDLWVWKIPWRRAWQPTPVFLPRESHGQRSLVGSTAHRILKSRTRLKWLSMQHVSIQYVFYQAFFLNVREKFKKSWVRNSFYWTTAWYLRIDIISFHGHWMHKFLQSLCRACAVITSNRGFQRSSSRARLPYSAHWLPSQDRIVAPYKFRAHIIFGSSALQFQRVMASTLMGTIHGCICPLCRNGSCSYGD